MVPDYKMGPTPLEIIERIRDRDPVDLVANLVTLRKQADDMKEKALKAYSFATHKAERFLVPAHPVRLSIALNFGVFQFEVVQDPETAKKTTRQAAELASKKLDQLTEERDLADSKIIIDLLRENLDMWQQYLNEQQQEKKQQEKKDK